MATPRKTIGAALDECISDTTEEWFRQHCGMRSREEAATAEIDSVHGTTERRSQGILRVFVTVQTHKRRLQLEDFYLYHLCPKRGYVRKEPIKAVS